MRWRKIPDSVGYEVSSTGIIRKHGVLVPTSLMRGYERFNCEFTDGTRTCLLVHRQVALMFVKGYFKGAVTNHIDGNKRNNARRNLEWTTQSGNVQHAYDIGLTKVKNKRGEKNVNVVLTDVQVHKICKSLVRGNRLVDIYTSMNLTKHLVLNIKKKRTWSHISDKYFKEAL